MKAPTFLSKYQTLVDHFGYWPAFHDANVMAYSAPRDNRPTLDFTLHTWEMTSEVDAKGHYVRRKHALVTFHFAGIHDASLERFDSGNVLFGMKITRTTEAGPFRVELDSAMGMSGDFSATYGEIISVIPCTSDAKAT